MAGQIQWSDTPEPEAKGSKLELIRCGIGRLHPLISINARHIGAELHYWQGRSFPHLDEGCPACAAKNTTVWKGYIGVWNPATRLVSILEFTRPCISALDAYFLAHGTCRGATIQLTRKGVKVNGTLDLMITPSKWGHDQLPEPINLRPVMMRMWGAKRLDDYIATEPTRPVVEPPATTREVETRRAQAQLLGETVDTNGLDIPLNIAARMLAGKLSIDPKPTNSKGKHP